MRIELLDEVVACSADFRGGQITPLRFWRGERELDVAQVHARWLDRSHKHPQFYFSAETSTGDVFELRLDSGRMLWRLQSVLLDG